MSASPDTPQNTPTPYHSQPRLAAHPDRLATLGHLFGLTPVDPRQCRVLELGCGDAGNLIPMALALPRAEFVGCATSASDIALGRQAIADLALDNIQLHALGVAELDAALGEFDYILAHGVYSSLSGDEQETLLRFCAENLSPNGIAYLSYATLPGWQGRKTARDLMRHHARGIADPGQRIAQARAILGFMSRAVPAENNALGTQLGAELARIEGMSDADFAHEYLDNADEPIYFHEFAGRAASQGLQYLGDADFHTMLTTNLAQDIRQTLARIAPEVARYEQFVDFVRNRASRKSLLVRKEQTISRDLTPERIMALHVGATLKPATDTIDLRPGVEATFQAFDNVSLTSSDPVAKAALLTLARAWPRTHAFEDLFRAALAMLKRDLPGAYVPPADAKTALATSLLSAYGFGGISLQYTGFSFADVAGAKPRASRLARWQAGQGRARVSNLRHMPVDLDADTARLLILLDGTRDRAALCQAFAESAAIPETPALGESIERALSRIAKLALLEP
jgi:methyltransferase-like protein